MDKTVWKFPTHFVRKGEEYPPSREVLLAFGFTIISENMGEPLKVHLPEGWTGELEEYGYTFYDQNGVRRFRIWNHPMHGDLLKRL